MGTLMQDLRYGIRLLLKNPGFTMVAVLTLALGIGANTAIFSVVNAVLLRPLPYPDADRLAQAHSRFEQGEDSAVTEIMYAFWKEHSQSFTEVGAYAGINAGFNLSGGPEPERVSGLRVSEGFLRVLGTPPALGRNFVPEEDAPGGPRVAVISHSLWRRYFGGDPAAVGRQMVLNGTGCLIVGVLPPDFRFDIPADILTPLQMKPDPRDDGTNTGMIVRLKPGITLQQAQTEMDRLLQQFQEAYPNHMPESHRGVRLIPYKEDIVGDTSGPLFLLSCAVAFVLLIACVNVANLLLTRSAARQGEMAVRGALGAGRWRLIRQLLTESLTLALAGGVAGWFVALWLLPGLLAMSPQRLPRLAEVGMDYQTALFALGVSILTSLLVGITPALRATRLDVNADLKATSRRGGPGKSDTRMRAVLIVSEVALSMILLAGAGLLIKSILNLRGVELGFNPEQVTTMQISLTSERYQDGEQAWVFERQVLDRIRTLPGVVSAAVTSNLPLERGLRIGISIAGQPTPGSIQCRAISPGYFRTMDIPLQKGRVFVDGDTRESAPVVIINEDLARRYWPDRDPVGDYLRFIGREGQIVGVARDIREMGLDRPVEPTFYVPASQMPDGLTVLMNNWFMTSWVVRTTGPIDLRSGLTDAVKGVDPQMPIANIRPLTQVVSASITAQRFLMVLMGSFAGLALILTAIGVYGVLKYQVSRRTHEIGIRMALGAGPRDVLSLMVGEGMLLTLGGIIIGAAGGFALTRLMSNLLFGVSAADPVTFLISSLLLGVVTLLASYLPARQAMRVDPMTALRYE